MPVRVKLFCLGLYAQPLGKQDIHLKPRCQEFAEQIPDIVVSDEYPAYPRAVRKALGRKVSHVQAHFKAVSVRYKYKWLLLSNNRVEGFNSWLRERITLLHGFKNDFYMQKFLEGFQKVWNANFLVFH